MFWRRERYQFHLDEDIPLSTPLDRLSFIVLDTETTGFAITGEDRLLEIGAVCVDNLQVTDATFQTYVNPRRDIPNVIKELTGIDEQKVKQAPEAKAALDGLFAFIESHQCNFLAGHYLIFDISLIEQELKRANCTCSKPKSIDTLDLLRLLNICIQGKQLEDYAADFDISLSGRHTAIGDAIITANLACQLLKCLQRRYRTWGELLFAFESRKRTFGG